MASKRRAKRKKTERASETAPSTAVLRWPLALTLALVALSWVPRVQANPVLVRSFWAAAAVLFVWLVALWLRLSSESATRRLDVVLRLQHYLQATVQLIPLILAIGGVRGTFAYKRFVKSGEA